MNEVLLNRGRAVAGHERVGSGWKPNALRVVLLWVALAITFVLLMGCGAINVGKFKGIEKAAGDEEYYLAKDIFLTAGSAANQRNSFDHNMHPSISLFFVPRTETNTYVAESVWYDPAGQEFKTIRTTYDKQRESKKGNERSLKGTTRIHTVSSGELFNHKPGPWKVALFLDNKLVRRLDFTLR
jgi:hypothetical protein